MEDKFKRLSGFIPALAILAICAMPALADTGVAKRLDSATATLREMMNAPDSGIPHDLLDKAACVIVIPNLKKGGFIVGAEYGRGFFSCRKASGIGWSAPGSLRVTGGKFGLLIGGAETDLIMLVMNKRGMEKILSNKTVIGAGISGAAGPVGRDSKALTDATMRAEILTWSRQHGLYGGIDLNGTAITQDDEANKELYGKDITNREIINGTIAVPPAARVFIRTLTRQSSRK